MGAFNLTRFVEERLGCEGDPNDMEAFNDAIRNLNLIDVPLGGIHLLGPATETFPPLLSMTVFSSPKLGMTCSHYLIEEHFPTSL